MKEYLRKNLQKEPLRRNPLKYLWEIIRETNFARKNCETIFERNIRETTFEKKSKQINKSKSVELYLKQKSRTPKPISERESAKQFWKAIPRNFFRVILWTPFVEKSPNIWRTKYLKQFSKKSPQIIGKESKMVYNGKSVELYSNWRTFEHSF